MFCPNCGSSNPDNATHCANCGISLNAQRMPAQNLESHQDAPANFKDHQTTNIILTIVSFLCCGGWIGVIFGVLGIVFGSQAKSAYAAGDYTAAESKAKTAKLMSLLALAMVILGAIISGILLLIYGGSLIALVASEMNFMLAL